MAAKHATGLVQVGAEAFRSCNVAQPSLPVISVLDALEISRYQVGQTLSLSCSP